MEILKGKKLNMTQIFLETGKVVPVTIISLDDSTKIQSETEQELLNKSVQVTGTSKGKGFSGGIKRWGFSKQGETRGAKNKVRAIGSIGAQTPGRVFPGKKMPGRHGSYKVTIKGLQILNIDATKNQIMVSGPIPGSRNSLVSVKVI